MTLVPRYAIIVAGGSGTRMGSEVPKQFLPLMGMPILMHTIKAFYTADPTLVIILVLPSSQRAYWENICNEYGFKLPHQVVDGGNTRFQSVRNGLDAITGEGVVAIHDGVRPLVPTVVVLDSYKQAEEKGSAVACVPLKESLRRINNNTSSSVDRNEYVQIQTPQTFQVALIKAAFHLPEDDRFTDDASVLEKFGATVHLIHGHYQNVKITTPEDMALAEAILKGRP